MEEGAGMSLVDNFKVPCTLLERSRVPDGEGGWATGWADGPTFQAAIVRNSSLAARVAEREGLTNVYTVTTSPNAALEFHDVFRRDADGQVFRVTSNGDDVQTPDAATFQFQQVSAEEWTLS